MPDDLLKIILAAVGGLAGGFATATITARSKIRELKENFRLAQQTREDEDRAKNQSDFLNPLRVATGDLHERMVNIKERFEKRDKLLQDTVPEVDLKIKGPRAEFEEWANGFGEYALSTLYTTMVYFARARKIRSELPFVKLSSNDDGELINKLTEVRKSFAGDYGIFEVLQDSLGSYMWKEDTHILSYREYCEKLLDPSTYNWFHRPIEYYGDFHQKTPEERQRIIDSLYDLGQFLARIPEQTAQRREMRQASRWAVRSRAGVSAQGDRSDGRPPER